MNVFFACESAEERAAYIYQQAAGSRIPPYIVDKDFWVTWLPPESHRAELRRDYAAMRPMFLDEPLPFDEMLTVLTEAEQILNYQ